MVSGETAVLNRVEELWDVLAQEFDDGGPGAVVQRVANAELLERNRVLKIVEGLLDTEDRPDALDVLQELVDKLGSTP